MPKTAMREQGSLQSKAMNSIATSIDKEEGSPFSSKVLKNAAQDADCQAIEKAVTLG